MEFYEVCYVVYAFFRAHPDILHLGGPELCQDSFPSNLTFEENSSPKISLTLCGVPQPVVQGEFNGETLIVVNTSVNSYTHNYTLQLPQLTQRACGKELTVKTTGHNGSLIKKTRIFLNNCKYFYCINWIRVLSQF